MELSPREEKRKGKSNEIEVASSDDHSFRRKSHDERWEESFQRLVDFKRVHGDCSVPYRYTEDPFLGRWVSLQRSIYKGEATRTTDPRMQSERVRRLNEIGFDWNPQDPRHAPWEQRYSELLEFAARHGHAQVPLGWKENVQLAHWVSAQRREFTLLKRGLPSRLTDDRLHKLNKINFVWKASRGKASSRHVGGSCEYRNHGSDSSRYGDLHASCSATGMTDQRIASTATWQATTQDTNVGYHNLNEWERQFLPADHHATIPVSTFALGAADDALPLIAKRSQQSPNPFIPHISPAQAREANMPVVEIARQFSGVPLGDFAYEVEMLNHTVPPPQSVSPQTSLGLDETSILSSYYRLLLSGMQQPPQVDFPSAGVVQGGASSLYTEQAFNFSPAIPLLSGTRWSSAPSHHDSIQLASRQQQDRKEGSQSGTNAHREEAAN